LAVDISVFEKPSLLSTSKSNELISLSSTPNVLIKKSVPSENLLNAKVISKTDGNDLFILSITSSVNPFALNDCGLM